MKESKKIFLYVKRASDNPFMMEKIMAISDDGKHRCDIKTDLNDYKLSVRSMDAEFEKFCVDECGFNSDERCDVWVLNDIVLDSHIDFRNDITVWLMGVSWCRRYTIEHEYKNRCFHLEKPMSFEQFKAENDYDESKEPYETKRIYEMFKERIDKNELSEREIKRTIKFIQEDDCKILSEAIGGNLTMRFKLIHALCALRHADMGKYLLQKSNLCNAVKKSINTMVDRFVDFIDDTMKYDDYKNSDEDTDSDTHKLKNCNIRQERIKIYLYVKMTNTSPYMMERIMAISEDEKHLCDIKIDINNYDLSVQNMKNEFKKFCAEVSGSDDFHHCKIFTLDNPASDVDLDEDSNIIWWLKNEDCECCTFIEYEYDTKCFNLETPMSFEEYKAANGYDESKEPFETKRICNIYEAQVGKKKFSEQEIKRIVQFISRDNYARLFEDIGINYPMTFKLSNALNALRHSDKYEYAIQIANMRGAVTERINSMIKNTIDILNLAMDDYYR